MRRERVERLYEQLGTGLIAYASAILGDRARAEDVLHQVFVKLLARFFPEPDDPQAYLYRAVRNAALNAQRSALRDAQLDADEAWFDAPLGMTEAALALQSSLKQIPEEQREVIVLKVWGEMTLEEVGEVLGISPNTAASRYRYGLAKLRHRLRPWVGE